MRMQNNTGKRKKKKRKVEHREKKEDKVRNGPEAASSNIGSDLPGGLATVKSNKKG